MNLDYDYADLLMKGVDYKQCDDYTLVAKKENLIIAVVNDGAGSRQHSYLGAEYLAKAAKKVIFAQPELVNQAKDEKDDIDPLISNIHKTWCRKIAFAIDNLEDKEGVFATTFNLLVLNLDTNLGFSFQLGDGYQIRLNSASKINSAADKQTGGITKLLPGHNGEFANTTLFLNLRKRLAEVQKRTFSLEENLGFIIGSDGLDGLLMNQNKVDQNNLVYLMNQFLNNDLQKLIPKLKIFIRHERSQGHYGDDVGAVFIIRNFTNSEEEEDNNEN
ncbi:protein phosphatase 2C domain-containing protein [Halanaerobacter jeridensis]|uniref:Serine/threonine protein phosphatase PrpC n=1 Tax=Halanaerobacter jeridensis TaxID=706427 RepID=A0A938XYT2_9FIRM|nr:protein phosphatase 2C domain-containing protein [Halanaerobacter jeridensis]MBM7557790.1 serine/threonine protein phosphatase PrpC [Halanaerobacter jeridensis]